MSIDRAVAVVSTPAAGRRHRDGYEHLAPLFAEVATLAVGHPDRCRVRDRLIDGYLPVARHIARMYAYRGEGSEDLEQVAIVGLVLAIDRFEPERGGDFLSFAVPTISGEVLRHFRDRTTAIRMPRRLRDLQPMVYDAAAELAQRNCRAARPSEIAHRLGVEVEVVRDCLQAQSAVHTSSLDEPGWENDGGTGGWDRYAAATRTVEPQFDLVEYRHALAPLLAALPERERHILMLRFVDGLTQTEIGHRTGISQMHVSRLLTGTLARLRRHLSAS